MATYSTMLSFRTAMPRTVYCCRASERCSNAGEALVPDGARCAFSATTRACQRRHISGRRSRMLLRRSRNLGSARLARGRTLSGLARRSSSGPAPRSDHVADRPDDGDLGPGTARFCSGAAGTPLPAPLRGAYTSEPLWIDLKLSRGERTNASRSTFRVCKLRACHRAAAVRGVPKEDLFSEELTQQRRALTTAWSGSCRTWGCSRRSRGSPAVRRCRSRLARSLWLDSLASKAQLLAIEEPVQSRAGRDAGQGRVAPVASHRLKPISSCAPTRLCSRVRVSTSRHAVKSLERLCSVTTTRGSGWRRPPTARSSSKSWMPRHKRRYGRSSTAIGLRLRWRFLRMATNLIAAGQDQAVETWDIGGNRLLFFPVPELQRSSLALIVSCMRTVRY